MDDLTAFLNARLDEDEAAVKGPPAWKLEHWSAVRYKTGVESGREWRVDAEPRCIVDAVAKEDAEHIARHDPARVLREVAAKRVIMRYYGSPVGFPGEEGVPGTAMRALAAVYSDHPDYRQEWTP
jgi:hypothetical protein